MELHGGIISVASEGIGMGSCFSVEIPIVSLTATAGVGLVSDVVLQETSAKESDSLAGSLLRFTWKLLYNFQACSRYRFHRRINRVTDNSRIKEFQIRSNAKHSADGHSISSAPLGSLFQGSAHFENMVDEKGSNVVSYSLRNISRVLIVDDVAMNRKMLKRLLVTRFEECKEAENGQQAVDMVKDTMLSGLIYDVIMMDYQMPIMDGVTASSSIRKLGYRGHIIGVTGNALQDDVNLFLANGADKVLTKPLSVRTLDEYLSTFI